MSIFTQQLPQPNQPNGPMQENITDHIYIHEPIDKHLILVYIEAPKTSVNQINEYFDRIDELTDGRLFHMVADLSNTNLPDPGVREAIKSRFLLIENQIISHQSYIGKNPLMRIALKFVSSAIGLTDTRSAKSLDHAFKRIQDEN